MSTPLQPTIGGPRPGFGVRARKDGPKSTASGDANCVCGEFAEGPVSGDFEVETLVRRYERHCRDECTNPAVRAAAALRDWRRNHPTKKRRK